MVPTAIAVRSTLVALLLFGGTMRALADPPGRVGRLSYMEGTVSFHAGDQDQWSAAVLNYPVTSGTAFWTEPAARAEIQIGEAEVRLDQSTELDIVRLDDAGTRLHVNQGVVNVHLRAAPPGGIHVVTPHSEADLLVAGSYRIDAGVAPVPEQVQIVVLEGEARIEEPRASLDIRPGESAVIGGDPVTFTLVEASTTPFDDWALMRERREVDSESARYVAPGVTGYEDLDRSGEWRTTPSQDAVWYPTAVGADWAPYRDGHWAYVQPWGWTWIDDAAWGFAPFHYGRWVNDDHGWGWHPGERIAQPVYAPALVAFIGGAGFGVALSAGRAPAVGWIPLAPTEVFHPYYPTSANYVRNVNIANVSKTQINTITISNTTLNTTTVNNYANRQAATVVPSAVFTRAAPVQKATLALPKEELAQVAMTAQIDHLQPTPAARAGMGRPATPSASVPGPNTPATVAKGQVGAQASPAVAAEPPVPKAPGPVNSAKIPASRVAPPAVAPAAPVATNLAAPPTRPAPGAPGPPIVHGNATPPVVPAPAAARSPGPPASVPVAEKAGAANAPPQVEHAQAAAPIQAAPPSAPAPSPASAHATDAPVVAAHQAPAASPTQIAAPPQAHAPPAQAAMHAPPAQVAVHAPPAQVAMHAPPAQAAAPAPPVIPHPVQQTRIAPTPSGWVRAPLPAPHAPTPPAAAQAQPAHAAPAAAPPSPAQAPSHADAARKPDHAPDHSPDHSKEKPPGT